MTLCWNNTCFERKKATGTQLEMKPQWRKNGRFSLRTCCTTLLFRTLKFPVPITSRVKVSERPAEPWVIWSLLMSPLTFLITVLGSLAFLSYWMTYKDLSLHKYIHLHKDLCWHMTFVCTKTSLCIMHKDMLMPQDMSSCPCVPASACATPVRSLSWSCRPLLSLPALFS